MNSTNSVSGTAGTRVTVEFATAAAGEAAVAGRVLDEHGHAVPFTGWIGLLEVLEAFATPRADPLATPAPEPARHEVSP